MPSDSLDTSRLNKTAPIYISADKNGVLIEGSGSPLGMKSRDNCYLEAESRARSRKSAGTRKSSKSRSRPRQPVSNATHSNGHRSRAQQPSRDLNVTSVSRSRSRKRSVSKNKSAISRRSLYVAEDQDQQKSQRRRQPSRQNEVNRRSDNYAVDNSNRRESRFKPSPRDAYYLRNRTVYTEESEADFEKVVQEPVVQQQTSYYNWMIDTPRKLISTPGKWIAAGLQTPRRWLFSNREESAQNENHHGSKTSRAKESRYDENEAELVPEAYRRVFFVLFLIFIALLINRFMFKKDFSVCTLSDNPEDLGIFTRLCLGNKPKSVTQNSDF